MTIKKRNYRLHFDRTIKSGQGFLFGIKIVQGSLMKKEHDLSVRHKPNMRKITGKRHTQFSDTFGHSDDVKTEASAKNHRYTLTGNYEPYSHCFKAKARQKNVSKIPRIQKTRRGELMYWDISSVKKKNVGGTKFRNLVIDDYTEMKLSLFMKKNRNYLNSVRS